MGAFCSYSGWHTGQVWANVGCCNTTYIALVKELNGGGEACQAAADNGHLELGRARGGWWVLWGKQGAQGGVLGTHVGGEGRLLRAGDARWGDHRSNDYELGVWMHAGDSAGNGAPGMAMLRLLALRRKNARLLVVDGHATARSVLPLQLAIPRLTGVWATVRSITVCDVSLPVCWV